METVFPTGTGYTGFFVIGWRKNPATASEIQQVGTVIVKRTYDIIPNVLAALGRLTPAEKPLPVFDQDVPENLVLNGNMEASQKVFGESENDTLPAAWQAEAGITAVLAQDGDQRGVVSVTGAAERAITQTIVFDEPLGGRSFSLSFHAKADANTTVNNICLAAGGFTICSLNIPLTPTYGRFVARGRWPAGVSESEMRVVLRAPTDSARTVFYDDIEVLERNYITEVDVTALRYESDLAPFKPEGDMVVLDYTDQGGTNRVRVNGNSRLERAFIANPSNREKALFGWEPRAGSRRKDEADFPPDESAYPLPEALPAGFNNRFYNGYRRDSLAPSVVSLPYLPPSASVEIERNGNVDYAFHLSGETITAAYYSYNGSGPDKETRWTSHDIPMNLDTLVIEPENDRTYAVWRGAWLFTSHPQDSYRRLVVTATG
jgi:hypothetical protein